MYMPHIKFQDSSISGSRVSQLPSITNRQMDGQTDGRTDGQAQTNMPPQLLRSWGHKTTRDDYKSYSVQLQWEITKIKVKEYTISYSKFKQKIKKDLKVVVSGEPRQKQGRGLVDHKLVQAP